VITKARLWLAKENGKDASQGETRLTVSQEYLWFGRDLSVPLAWVTQVDPVGPGFRIVWEDRVSGRPEGAVFCIRTMFGYNKKKRDQLVSQLQNLAQAATEQPKPVAVVQAETLTTCEKCNDMQTYVIDFDWIINVLVYWVRKPDRRILCLNHAAHRFRANLFFNAVLGTLGIPGIIVTPFLVFTAGRQPTKAGFVSPALLVLALLVSVIPALLLTTMIVLLILETV